MYIIGDITRGVKDENPEVDASIELPVCVVDSRFSTDNMVHLGNFSRGNCSWEN